MKQYVSAFLAVGLASSAWAQGDPAPGRSTPFAVDVEQRSLTVTGMVVSAQSGALTVRIDDHGHGITFSPGPRVSPAELRAGSRVRVHYHPAGSTGQIADEVEVLAGPRGTNAR